MRPRQLDCWIKIIIGAPAPLSASTRRVLDIVRLILVVSVVCFRAYGDVGVVLNESLDRGLSRITGAGHSAVYFSRICAASPVELRLCFPDEEGSIISSYNDFGFGKDHDFEWNIVPFSVYFYGVENPRSRPLFASARIKDVIEENYRNKFLAPYCATAPCATTKKGLWRAMVGTALHRTSYIFVVQTSEEQDREFIAKFNARPNLGRFSGITRNCADFTREIINTYFPKAAGRNYLNDFGMVSPKAVARSFVQYARRNPELQYRVLHVPQLPGTVKRSKVARAGTEQLFRSKKLVVPMLLVATYAVPVSAFTYFVTGRFNPQRELEKSPTARATELAHQTKLAKSEKDAALIRQLEASKDRERARVLGSSEEWRRYREAFAEIVSEAALGGLIQAREPLDGIFKRLDQMGAPVLDENGALRMEIQNDSGMIKVGLGRYNILDPDSDPRLAYQLMLARIDRSLKSPARNRPSVKVLEEDWAILQQARARFRSQLP